MDRERRVARAGFTVVEAIVAVAIVGILVAGVVGAFTQHLRINTDSETRTGAVAAAQTVLDRLRGVAAATWPPTGTVQAVASHGRTYEVEIRHQPYSEGGVTFAGARFVEVEVRYAGRARYTVASVFTRLD